MEPIAGNQMKLGHALATVRDWSLSNDKRKADWEATVANAIRDGWALKGFGEKHNGGTPGGTKGPRNTDQFDALLRGPG
ncbi:MAG: hypothetical protein V3V08_23485 [Nannocystaceae bacterium]